MTAAKFTHLLIRLRACEEARTWAKGKTLEEVWSGCDRGDWLLWLAGRMADEPGWPTHKQVVLAVCGCAERALQFVPAGEDGPLKCLKVVRAWATGNATLDEVREARRAAATAYADAAAADAAAAAYAADAAAGDAAAYAAADAAYAYAAAAAARLQSLSKSADIVRAALPAPSEVAR
jgi:hypothetical protein